RRGGAWEVVRREGMDRADGGKPVPRAHGEISRGRALARERAARNRSDRRFRASRETARALRQVDARDRGRVRDTVRHSRGHPAPLRRRGREIGAEADRSRRYSCHKRSEAPTRVPPTFLEEVTMAESTTPAEARAAGAPKKRAARRKPAAARKVSSASRPARRPARSKQLDRLMRQLASQAS